MDNGEPIIVNNASFPLAFYASFTEQDSVKGLETKLNETLLTLPPSTVPGTCDDFLSHVIN